jgi:hypothetical protein
MNTTTLVLQGIVKPDGTLELSEPLNLPAGRVQVTVQPLPEAVGRSEIDAQRQALRSEMEEEIQEAMRLQESARRARDVHDHQQEQE